MCPTSLDTFAARSCPYRKPHRNPPRQTQQRRAFARSGLSIPQPFDFRMGRSSPARRKTIIASLIRMTMTLPSVRPVSIAVDGVAFAPDLTMPTGSRLPVFVAWLDGLDENREQQSSDKCRHHLHLERSHLVEAG